MRLSRRALLGTAAALALGRPAAAQPAWPAGPIRIIVPFGPGSATDLMARLLAEPLSQAVGQPVVVDNRGGGDGIIASELVARAKPDGLTVMVTANTTHGSNPALHRTLPYDPLRDFAPVTLIGTTALLVLVHPSLPVRTVGELIAHAKAHPGKLNFSSGSASSRVAGEMFKSMAGVDMVNVTYRSNPQAIADLVTGQVQVMFCDATTARPQSQAGRVRALAVTSRRRSPAEPDLPTVAESGAEAGLADYEMVAWNAVYLPAGTPPAIVETLNRHLVGIMREPVMQARIVQNGMDMVASAPKALGDFTAAEIEKWKRIVAAARIELE